MTDRLSRARASLLGLAVGDALGEALERYPSTAPDDVPPAPWHWTDDTQMACSVLRVLATRDHVDVDALEASFVAHYDLDRNYGPGVDAMMREVARRDVTLRALAKEAFGGAGSWGNGAAMRIAPLGAWYHDDARLAADGAVASAVITHTHPDGVAGAVAVAVAASLAAAGANAADVIDGVLHHTPAGKLHDGLRDAANLAGVTPAGAASALGTGRALSAPDTVPLALWIAAHHLDDYEKAIRTATAVAEDVDTVCAIVGGIVCARSGEDAIPEAWLRAAEPLPAWVLDGVD